MEISVLCFSFWPWIFFFPLLSTLEKFFHLGKILPFSDFSFVGGARNYNLNYMKGSNLVVRLKDLQWRLFTVSWMKSKHKKSPHFHPLCLCSHRSLGVCLPLLQTTPTYGQSLQQILFLGILTHHKASLPTQVLLLLRCSSNLTSFLEETATVTLSCNCLTLQHSSV